MTVEQKFSLVRYVLPFKEQESVNASCMPPLCWSKSFLSFYSSGRGQGLGKRFGGYHMVSVRQQNQSRLFLCEQMPCLPFFGRWHFRQKWPAEISLNARFWTVIKRLQILILKTRGALWDAQQRQVTKASANQTLPVRTHTHTCSHPNHKNKTQNKGKAKKQ